MSTVLVTYDLRKPGRDYAVLFDAIKSISPIYSRCLESVWVVKTAMSCAQVRDLLQQNVGAGDGMLVVNLSGEWATTGLSPQCNEWLKANY